MKSGTMLDYVEKLHKAVAVHTASELKYELEKLEDCKSEFFKRCAPCREGERVVIVRELNIPESSGWYHCAHFLVLGAKGTAHKVDFFGGRFRIDVVYDDESWVDRQGNEHKVEDKHTFCMGEKDIEVLTSSKGDTE